MAKTRVDNDQILFEEAAKIIFLVALVPWDWSADRFVLWPIRIALLGLAGRSAWRAAEILEPWQRSQIRASLGAAAGALAGYIIWATHILGESQTWQGWVGRPFGQSRFVEIWPLLMAAGGIIGYCLVGDRVKRVGGQGFWRWNGAYSLLMVLFCLIAAIGPVQRFGLTLLLPLGILLLAFGIYKTAPTLTKAATGGSNPAVGRAIKMDDTGRLRVSMRKGRINSGNTNSLTEKLDKVNHEK